MKRREFIAALGGAAAWPVLANALDAASPVVGFLYGISFKGPLARPYWAAFREGLASLGYVEGQNLKIELREAEGHYERLPDLAADLVKLQPARPRCRSATRDSRAQGCDNDNTYRVHRRR
jgi:putative ABC transport system substrate-binding protein